MIGPEVVFYTVFYPRMRDFADRVLSKALGLLAERRTFSPQTAAYLDYTDPWPDGWAGPRLRVSREAGPGTRLLRVEGWIDLSRLKERFTLTVSMDGRKMDQKAVRESGYFRLEFPMLQFEVPGIHVVEVKASAWFVPHVLMGNGDYRPLSFRMEEIRFC